MSNNVIGRLAKLTCQQRDSILGHGTGANEVYKPWSSVTDFVGEYGEPRVETVWAPDFAYDKFVVVGVHDILHPSHDNTQDVQPCEHWVVLIDWRDDETDS